MVSLYNISGSTNFSGVFENFVNESTLKEALSETEDVDSISSSSVKGTHSNSKLQSKPHSSFWKRYGQNNFDSQSFSASTINKAKRSEVEFEHFKPPLHNNDDLSIFSQLKIGPLSTSMLPPQPTTKIFYNEAIVLVFVLEVYNCLPAL
ncbi:hypothetical protein ACJJTC_004625 [Scirpophaga incertulas]